ncbi:MAG: tetratricopeptide repeat protein, partial [Moorea sp. SIO4A1]|uniref:tetratricopeptide repeat protein n=1 Tax=Moorena sp. SIO4A1 TaxID=2607835 RepID=UPI00144D8129
MKKISFVIAITLTCFVSSAQALSNSPVITPDYSITDSPEQQAQQLYETGQYQDAIPLLEQMISNYRESGDLIGEINSLVNLALVYQRLGNLDQALETIYQSFTQLSQLDNTKERQELQAQILSVQGQVYLSLGQGEKALSIWQETSAIYQDIGD